jgi:hypothetical protein
MAAAVFMTLDGSTLVFATSQASLPTTPDLDASCQISSASITTVENSSDLPGTMCDPKSTIALPSGATLDVTFLQDWSEVDGFCWYAADNDAVELWFQFLLGEGSTPAAGPGYTGQTTLRRPQFGGDGGAPLEATVSYPARNLTAIKPT